MFTNKVATETDDSRQLTPGPPPESGARRTMHHHRQQSSPLHASSSGSPQPMRMTSLRRPSSFVAKRQSVFAGGFANGNRNGNAGGGGRNGSKSSLPPPLGVQSYQMWVGNAYKRPQAPGGPSRSSYRTSQTAFDSGAGGGEPITQQHQFVPPQIPLDPSLNQTLLTLQSLVPAAVAYLEANPDIDQALGLLVSRFSPSLLLSSIQQQKQQPVLQQLSNISRGGTGGNGSVSRMGAPNYRPGQAGGQQHQVSRQMKQASEGGWNKRKSNGASATSGRGKSN